MSTTHKSIIISILCSLDGGKKAVDLETLAVSCFRAFPSKFSMDRFPEYPRIDRVQKRMNEIEKDGLVRRNQATHYQLTEKGTRWVKSNPKVMNLIAKQREKEGLDFRQTLNYNISEAEYEIEAKKLRRSEAYRKYKAGAKDSISIIDFMTFMKVDIYAKKELFDRKTKRIKSICLRNNELRKMFSYLDNKYGLDYGYFSGEVKKISKALKGGTRKK